MVVLLYLIDGLNGCKTAPIDSDDDVGIERGTFLQHRTASGAMDIPRRDVVVYVEQERIACNRCTELLPATSSVETSTPVRNRHDAKLEAGVEGFKSGQGAATAQQ